MLALVPPVAATLLKKLPALATVVPLVVGLGLGPLAVVGLLAVGLLAAVGLPLAVGGAGRSVVAKD